MAMTAVNPATGGEIESFETLTPDQVEEKVALADRAFREYRKTSFAERARMMTRAAEILEDEAGELGRAATLEMGKSLVAAKAEVQKCARGCRYYAENAERFLADEPVDMQGADARISYKPVGPVLAVMPWNFPYWQAFRHIAPGLMAGNVVLLKHASNVPRTALNIEDIVRRAGFPEGVMQTLLVGSGQIESLIDDSRIRGVTLTGSEGAGRAVGGQAGKAVKNSVLELGGSDPFVVMPSADLDAAVESAVGSRMLNNGQSCINAKRFIVHEEVYEEFERRFVEKVEAMKIGDPMDEDTDMGPLAMQGILEEVEDQVQRSVDAGARVLAGGRRPDGMQGNYYLPTVLSDIPEGSPARVEEIFGPVASLFRVGGLDEAISLANDTHFGLGASVWTTESTERGRFVEEIESGMLYVNRLVESTPEMPFGGVKDSGYGRELSHFGVREFTNAKAVWIEGGENHAGGGSGSATE
ncbi:NAD-dependent succinate-semialdehyde dehydrogenase [Rubrobacter aplysinae]|uniref:NAD-dependent succinate-semialdehyde dehydrogenase n=1 Tax=Rubrobacter aplysinae TaxID=909625 RepID=UPI00064BEE41|nr:NAD-dependent succinate-semialdehyde dehydrogenase [Rubrobacter aplysinae]